MFSISKLFTSANEKYLKQSNLTVQKINDLEKEFESFSDEELKQKTSEFKQRLEKGETLDSLLVQAFALVREASKRTLDQRHFNVQLLGGIVLHQGKIAEMKTGEGKTLAATLATYLNALTEKGVHVITVNDYLSRRDTVWMGQIYDFLGLSVACLNHEQAFTYDSNFKKSDQDEIRDEKGGFKIVEDYLRPCSRKQAYLADITYGTNNEFGFDFLRDNMVFNKEQEVQRGHFYAVLDEVDSILIDESRTPLIISAPDMKASNMYSQFASLIPSLNENDYEIDEERKLINLTDNGIDRVEKILKIDNIYAQKGVDFLHHLEQALRAQILYQKDREYVVRDGKIIIVDEFTGRLMPGRRWSSGLHQAIEAKERVEIQPESQTLATITFQNYFKLYEKISGMTGTAVSSAEEFDKVYGLDVISVPTNKPLIRKDLQDQVYKTEKAKFQAIVQEVKQRNKKGQPILIGTRSIEKNEYLGKLLQTQGIDCQILNAKHHEKEAQIIAQAGKAEAVTVATNMAGRGVDIILGGNPVNQEEAEKVKSSGGLYVIGTERHEARRIDNQLRGRSGRQGDSGTSQFFLCLDDDLLRVFGGDRVKTVMEKLNIPEDQVIEANVISKTVEAAQTKIEGMYFDTRRNLLDYDNVMSKHRDVFYSKRKAILSYSDQEIEKELISLFEKQGFKKQDFENKKKEIGDEFLKGTKLLFLQTMNFFWIRHLEDMQWLKDSVRLQGYAKVDPLVSYKTEGYEIFQEMMNEIKLNVVNVISGLNKKGIPQQKPEKEVIHEQEAGRNDPCPCGSGKKYKKCHWGKS